MPKADNIKYIRNRLVREKEKSSIEAEEIEDIHESDTGMN